MGIGQWGYNGHIDIENKQWGCLRLGTHGSMMRSRDSGIGLRTLHSVPSMGLIALIMH